MNVSQRRRKNAPANSEDLTAHADGFRKISGDVRERRKKEIPEIVAYQTSAGSEAILKQAPQQGLIFRQGYHAVANIARRQDAIFAAQAAGRATVIGNRDNSDQIRN